MFNLAVFEWLPTRGGRIDEVLRMECWLYCGWMGGGVGLWTCMCTCISIHAYL